MIRTIARTRPTGVLAALVAVAFAAPAAANLLVNPGFEDGGGSFNGWTISEGSSYAISDASNDNIYRSGAAAAKIYGEGTGCPIPNFDVTLFGQAVTAIPGRMYEFSGYSFVSPADPIPGPNTCVKNRAIAKIVFFNAPTGGVELSSNELVIGDSSTPQGVWNRFSLSAPAPTNALRVETLIIFLQPGCDSGATFVDDLSLTASTPPAPPANLLANPSFTNGLTGWTRFGANEFPEARAQYVRTPTGSAKLFGPFGDPGGTSGLYQNVSATAGLDYEFKVFSKWTCDAESVIGPGNQNYAIAKLAFRDSGGNELSAVETVLEDATTVAGFWDEGRVVATAPLGTATVEALIIFIQPDPTDGGAVFFDDASLVQRTLVDAPVVAQGPLGPELRQNVPNPFGSATRIDFVLASRTSVDLGVYDVTGRQVRTLVSGPYEAGVHGVTWDGRTADGKAAAAGMYFYVLRTPAGQTSRSMSLVR